MTSTSATHSDDTNVNIQEFEREFSKRIGIYNQLEEEGKHTLEHILSSENIKIHTIISRVKEKNSLIEKIKRKESANPFDEITDIVGIRIICLFLSDIQKIENVIKNNFDVILIDNKINDINNSNLFGYMSAHYIVKFKQEFAGFRYDSIKNIPFEIQVRTISMDAWANISHFLEYKSETDIPQELKRDFNALSGLFYVADTHFEMFYLQNQSNKQEIIEKVDSIINKKLEQPSSQELNFDSLSTYLLSKFPDRQNSPNEYISHLVKELLDHNYTTIESINNVIDNNFEMFKEFEEMYKPVSDKPEGGKFLDVGVIRITFALADEKYRRNSKYVVDHYDEFMKRRNKGN